jgi:hypothetical protein
MLCRVILAGDGTALTELRGRLRAGASSARPAPAILPVVAWFLGITVPLGLVVAAAEPFPTRVRSMSPWTGVGWLDGWVWYDSGWYQLIASTGYFYVEGLQSSVAFFPAYPLVVRAVAAVVGNVQLAGMLVTPAAGAAAMALFVVWLQGRLPRAAAITAVLVALLYPYAFFLHGTMYADAFFLLTAIGSFVLLERGHPVLAGLVGIMATAGRPVGVAITIGLVVRVIEKRATEHHSQHERAATDRPVRFGVLVAAVRRLRPGDYGVLLSGLGLAGWCTYLWVTFGNPLAFVAAESAPGWDQGVGPRTWFKIGFFGTLVKGPPDIAVTLAVQALLCLTAVLLLRRVWRRFGWGYLAYVLIVIGIPLIGTKDFMGTGRYLLAAFPIAAAAGDALASSRHARWLRPVVLGLLAVGMLAGTMLYARGYEVS